MGYSTDSSGGSVTLSRSATSRPADIELVLAARPENVAVVRHVLGGVGDALGMDARAVADLRLAVSEACTNVVVHAYEDASNERLEVEASVAGNLLNVTVRDHGRGLFPPRADSPGLGLGLPIARAVASSLELGESVAGNEVRMTFVVPDPG
jgi:anti-sigma regulatory factor (Ser/Thr protein kinase)